MSYTVIHAFTDLQDNNHVYLVGDKFPHHNNTVSADRVNELMSSNNKIREPLIKETADDFAKHMNPPEEPLPFSDISQEEARQYTKTEINRLSTAELKDLAKENGIDNAEGLTGGELKKMLIEKFGL